MCCLLGLTVCLILIPVAMNTQEPQVQAYTHNNTFPLRSSQDLFQTQ